MKKAQTLRVPKSLAERFSSLSINRSAAICQSLMNVDSNPHLIAQALQLRLTIPATDNDTVIKYTRDTRLDETVVRLSRMTSLSGEQIVRLSMEAYINRL